MTKFNRTEVSLSRTSIESNRKSVYAFLSSFNSAVNTLQSTDRLNGDGWQSAKDFYVVYDTINRSLLNNQLDFSESYNSFMASFDSEVGGTENVLDSDQLYNLQAELNQLEAEKQNLLIQMSGNMILELSFGGLALSWKKNKINSVQKKIDLLEKYIQFESSHAADFSGVLETLSTIQEGVNALSKVSFDVDTGIFNLSGVKNSSWFQNLTTYNESQSINRTDIILETVFDPTTKTYKNIYNVYIDGVFNQQATDNLFKLYEDERTENFKHLVGEVTGAYDLYRLLNGLDPATGDEASRLEAAAWLLLMVLPFDEFMKASKTFVAGDKLLKGADLTADQLKLLDSMGYTAKLSNFKVKKVKLANGEIAYRAKDGSLVRSSSYLNDAGNIRWPKENGFVTDANGKAIMSDANVKKGTFLDRYGNSGGTFTSPLENGTPLNYDARGLPYPESQMSYHKYEVTKDINMKNVQAGYDNLSLADQRVLSQQMKDYNFNLNDMANPKSGRISEVFGTGGGTQIKLGTSVEWYEKLGILKEVR